MALSIELSNAARSRKAHTELVAAVRDASASEQEKNWLEWKARFDLASKSGEATVAKTVQGFANRRPDVAARAMEGCAYLLVGVEPSSVSGVKPLDQAKLEAGVNVYAGTDVEWHADYVELDGKTVLVVTVEAPRWGDHIRAFQKSYLPVGKGRNAIPAGTIFVRHAASTERASPADIQMLSRRAAHTPGSELDVEVQAVAGTELGRVDVSPRTIEMWAISQEGRLRSAVKPRGAVQTIMESQGLMGTGEYRSEEEYLIEVGEYGQRLRNDLPQTLLARSVLHELGLLRLEVVNRIDTTFADVQVQLRFPDAAGVCVWRGDAWDKAEPPLEPTPYGLGKWTALRVVPALFRKPDPRPGWVPVMKRTTDAVYVTFEARDVRPTTVPTALESVWLMLNGEAPETIEIRWEATARTAKGRCEGVIVVPVGARLFAPAELLADPPSAS